MLSLIFPVLALADVSPAPKGGSEVYAQAALAPAVYGAVHGQAISVAEVEMRNTKGGESTGNASFSAPDSVSAADHRKAAVNDFSLTRAMPEPTTTALLLAGLGVLVITGRRRRMDD
jgi:hypothetical protein